ncbi:MAG: ornithine cyclodeaminase family protein [Mogibacterium diversum]|jgi:putative ornithine cyclodeaminase|uniref:ornithine cyclodeaminase family protein n=1 Tax=Mogibacterium diversum TaxID=114527 RepID=UPI001CB27E5D|nr:ornithine cyclodeaminase family protein [Mogibacterium diversum]MBF1341274.1 ornithine cyclodeaminase family protein [Mogibacterium diversum]MBF1358111.1 ornithine cyclodeaminase family protein [Mogibacterium diversum]
MLLLNEQDIRKVFDMNDAIDSNIEAYKIFSSGNAVVPLRQVIAADEGRGNFAFMPAYSSKLGAAGIKIVNIFPGNRERGEATTIGQVLLMDDKNGEVLALMDGSFITKFRTGAASGAAFKLFARNDAKIGCLIGTGGQADCQLEAMLAACNLDEVRIVARDFAKTEKFAEEMSEIFKDSGAKLIAYDDANEAVDGADVIVVVTVSTEPVFDANRVKKGAVVSGVGSYTAEMNEIDPKLFKLADKIYFDSKDACIAESADIQIPLREGLVSLEGLTGDIGEYALGEISGRESDDEIIIFKNVGLGILDLVIAKLIYEKAKNRKIGYQWG